MWTIKYVFVTLEMLTAYRRSESASERFGPGLFGGHVLVVFWLSDDLLGC